MNLMDLYERQQQELERFKALRDKVWQQILDDNEKLTASFGGKEFLSSDAEKTYNSRINSFNAEWSMEGGARYNEMLDQHEKQRQQATGAKIADNPSLKAETSKQERRENTTKDRFRNQSDRMTDKNAGALTDDEKEKQQLKQKIARQQAAIKARNLQKKKGR